MLNRVKIVAVAGAVIILLATVVVWTTAGCDGGDPATAPVVEQIGAQQPRQPAEQHTEAPEVTESAEAVREATTDPGQDEDKPVIVVVQREEVQPVDQQQEVAHGLFMEDIYLIPATLEEMVIKADIIARVRLLSVKPAAVRSDPIYSYDRSPPEGLYIGGLAYRLNVLEYLKGDSASTTITAFAYGQATIGDFYATTTVAGAEQLGRALLTSRDARWDDREAIVLLRYNSQEQHHYLGLIGIEAGAGRWDFTVASEMWKSWLPDADAPTTSLDPRRDSPGPQRFLLYDPDNYPSRSGQSGSGLGGIARSTGSSTQTNAAVPTATLDGLRNTVRRLLRELEGGDGSQEYRACVVEKYELLSRSKVYHGSGADFLTVSSGMPAGTWVFESASTYTFQNNLFPSLDVVFWSEGPDRDVLIGAWPALLKAARPLPAGKYNAWLRGLSAGERVCGDPTPEVWRKVDELVLTVMAPAGTLAESFFDPYADGGAVTGTTTVGTISWQAGRVTADLDIDATGHALDFIVLDGTTTLSLIVADATENGGTLTWTVPTQPWSAGDKLMLRIRRQPT